MNPPPNPHRSRSGRCGFFYDWRHRMTCNCSPREQWTFTGRETHWGYTYLIWTRDDGKRFARWVG